MPALPTGTVTFLFTDLQGNTRLWEQHPEAMRLALARHDALLRQVIQDNQGVVFKTIGDAFCAAFHTAPEALRAALAGQLTLAAEVWPEPLTLQTRMALHTGAADERDSDYFGQPLNRVARILAAGHGGQTLLSDVTADLCLDTLPSGVSLHSLGAHTLRDLGRRETLFQLQHPDLPADFPLLKTLDTLPTNLPPQVTSFIGREKELETAKSLLTKTRLLTFAGSGGSGKTRLALQLAAEVLGDFAEGVWLVELAALLEPGLLAATVAQALGIKEQSAQTLQQTLLNSLKGKSLLLVLDNCEHLLAACAQLVATVLRSCPSVKVLTTSREALGIAGEQTYRVPSLTAPDLKRKATPESLSQYESVRLFTDRACFHKPEFAITDVNASAVAQVCHHLDGIPLAIELAAARIRSLPVEEINTRLDSCFRLLTGGDRSALPRQQTLRALIDWSYDLLTDQEKLLLCRLCVFTGGWTLAAAEQIGAGERTTGTEIEAWEVFDLLTSLVDKSLVLAEEQGSTARYRLLETVRQYGRDRLVESGESEAVRKRHRDHFLSFAEQAEPELIGPEQGEWMDRLEAEHENLRAGLDWSLSGEDASEALRFCGALLGYWDTRGYHTEGREWCVQALDKSRGDERTEEHRAVRAKALHSAGYLATRQGDYASARAFFDESLAIRREIGNQRGIAATLSNLGRMAYLQGDYASAHVFHEESLAIRREIGDRDGIATSLSNLGRVVYEEGDSASARALHEESLAIYGEIGNQKGIAIALRDMGLVDSDQSDYASARALFDESLAIYREIRDRDGMAFILNSLGLVAYEQDDYQSARALHEESLMIHRELGNQKGIAIALEGFAHLAARAGRVNQAARLWGAAEALREQIGTPPPLDERGTDQQLVAQARELLGEEAFAAAWAAGRSMALELAIECALQNPASEEP